MIFEDFLSKILLAFVNESSFSLFLNILSIISLIIIRFIAPINSTWNRSWAPFHRCSQSCRQTTCPDQLIHNWLSNSVDCRHLADVWVYCGRYYRHLEAVLVYLWHSGQNSSWSHSLCWVVGGSWGGSPSCWDDDVVQWFYSIDELNHRWIETVFSLVLYCTLQTFWRCNFSMAFVCRLDGWSVSLS